MSVSSHSSTDASTVDLKHTHHQQAHHSPRKSFRSRLPSAQALHFDIDKYLNRFVVQNQSRRLPLPLARWFGYRSQPVKEVGNLLIAFWACIGAFIGLTVVSAVYKYAPGVADLQPPVIFASLGATAILEYNTIQSPLAQPRASIVGHACASIIGVAVAKLFMLRADFDSIRWLAGAVSCGIASATMTLTNTVHPPGGATAVLAVVTPEIAALGWWFPPLILLGSIIMMTVGLLVNNVQRQFPQFWWTPRDVRRVRKSDVEEGGASRKGDSETTHVESVDGPVGLQFNRSGDAQLIVIGPHGLVLPEGFTLGPEEKGVVQILSERLREEFGPQHGHYASKAPPARSEGQRSSLDSEGDDKSEKHGSDDDAKSDRS